MGKPTLSKARHQVLARYWRRVKGVSLLTWLHGLVLVLWLCAVSALVVIAHAH